MSMGATRGMAALARKQSQKESSLSRPNANGHTLFQARDEHREDSKDLGQLVGYCVVTHPPGLIGTAIMPVFCNRKRVNAR